MKYLKHLDGRLEAFSEARRHRSAFAKGYAHIMGKPLSSRQWRKIRKQARRGGQTSAH